MVFVHVGLGVLVEGLKVARAECAEAAGVDAGRRVEVGGFRVLLQGDGGGGLVAADVALGYLLRGKKCSMLFTEFARSREYFYKFPKSLILLDSRITLLT